MLYVNKEIILLATLENNIPRKYITYIFIQLIERLWGLHLSEDTSGLDCTSRLPVTREKDQVALLP